MKKLFKNLIFIILMFPLVVLGKGTYNGTVPSSSYIGDEVTFTVTLSNTAAWNVKLDGTGATSGCTKSYVDVTEDGKNTTKSLTVTCKATKEGTITFTLSGDITSADGSNNTVSLTKTVDVLKPKEKDTEARLSTLTIDGYKIDFDKDKFSYSINVNPTVTSINIKATAMSTAATVTGTGKKTISDKGDVFEITCTSESGVKKTYKINVVVKDENPINVKINNDNYTVVKYEKLLTNPGNLEESRILINDINVPCFKKDNLVIVGLLDTNGNIKYALYDNGDYNLYNEVKSSELTLLILNKELEGYDECKVEIDGTEYNGYNYDDRFKIVYALNLKTGEYNYYKFDTTDSTFQYFNDLNNDNDYISYKILCVFYVILFILIIVYVCQIVNQKKKKK